MKLQTRDEAEHIRRMTIEMAALVKEAVGGAIRAFLGLDAQKGREVVENDGEINTLEMKIDRAIF